jgi:hypothetical protein
MIDGVIAAGKTTSTGMKVTRQRARKLYFWIVRRA